MRRDELDRPRERRRRDDAHPAAEQERDGQAVGIRVNEDAFLSGIGPMLFRCKLQGDALSVGDAEGLLEQHFDAWNEKPPNGIKVRNVEAAIDYCMQDSGLIRTVQVPTARVQYTDRRFYDFLVAYHLNQQVTRYGWAGTPSP